MHRGFTFVEVLVAAAVAVIIGTLVLVNYGRQRSHRDLKNTTDRVVSILRDAGSRAAAQSQDSAWGVHFEQNNQTRFFTLFSFPYGTTTRSSFSALPNTLRFDTSTFTGVSKEIIFSRITGLPTSSGTIRIFLVSDPTRSSTIFVRESGVVDY